MILQAAYVPKSHRTHYFLKKEHVLYILEIAWIRATLCGLTEFSFGEGLSLQDGWHLAGRNLQSSVGVTFFCNHAALVTGNNYTFLRGFAKHQPDAEVDMDGLEESAGFPELSINQLHERIQSCFPLENYSIDEGNRVYCNHIINSGNPPRDRADRDKVIARYTLMHNFLAELLDSTPTGVKLFEERAAPDVWLV